MDQESSLHAEQRTGQLKSQKEPSELTHTDQKPSSSHIEKQRSRNGPGIVERDPSSGTGRLGLVRGVQWKWLHFPLCMCDMHIPPT